MQWYVVANNILNTSVHLIICKTKEFFFCVQFPNLLTLLLPTTCLWCSGYHICLTHRRSLVRSQVRTISLVVFSFECGSKIVCKITNSSSKNELIHVYRELLLLIIIDLCKRHFTMNQQLEFQVGMVYTYDFEMQIYIHDFGFLIF